MKNTQVNSTEQKNTGVNNYLPGLISNSCGLIWADLRFRAGLVAVLGLMFLMYDEVLEG
jgi:hypothetical protein